MLATFFFLGLVGQLVLATPVAEQLRSRGEVPSWNGPFHQGPAEALPGKETWNSFKDLFNKHKDEMYKMGDSDEDIGRMWNAIESAKRYIDNIPENVIFCIIMEESSGDVGVQNTGTGGSEKGLMQSRRSPGFPGQHNLSQVCSY